MNVWLSRRQSYCDLLRAAQLSQICFGATLIGIFNGGWRLEEKLRDCTSAIMAALTSTNKMCCKIMIAILLPPLLVYWKLLTCKVSNLFGSSIMDHESFSYPVAFCRISVVFTSIWFSITYVYGFFNSCTVLVVGFGFLRFLGYHHLLLHMLLQMRQKKERK